MTTLVGGLRARLVEENLFNWIHDGLAALGWLDPNATSHIPVTMRSTPVAFTEEVPLNTVALAGSSTTDSPLEVGSDTDENTQVHYVDVYGEKDSIAKHLIYDIRDLLRGKVASAGRTSRFFPVYDLTQATPPLLFHCETDNFVVDRAHEFPHLWQQHWFSLRFDVIDTYANEGTPDIVDGGSVNDPQEFELDGGEP